MFEGAMVALVTPFRDGKVDEKALRKLVKIQIQNGTDALVPSGTTGESATLTHAEHRMVTDIVIDESSSKIPVIAGTGSNNTTEAVERKAEQTVQQIEHFLRAGKFLWPVP